MENIKLLEKFMNDTVKIEKKLVEVRKTTLDGNSYRNLVGLYKDSINNMEIYNSNYENPIEFEKFCESRNVTINNELIELEKITNALLENDNFKEYKMFNQSFQDLTRVLNTVKNIINKYKRQNEYNKLLNYRRKESFIDKNLLLKNIISSNDMAGKSLGNYMSIDFGRAEGSNNYNCIVIIIRKDDSDTMVDSITTYSDLDVKLIYKYIKDYCRKNPISKIILDANNFGRALADYIREDEELKGKLFEVKTNQANRGETFLKMLNDLFTDKIFFINRSCRGCIDKELLILFNEIQNTRLEGKSDNSAYMQRISQDYGLERFNCIMNYYNYEVNKEFNNDIRKNGLNVLANQVNTLNIKAPTISGVISEKTIKEIAERIVKEIENNLNK